MSLWRRTTSDRITVGTWPRLVANTRHVGTSLLEDLDELVGERVVRERLREAGEKAAAHRIRLHPIRRRDGDHGQRAKALVRF